MDVLFAVMPFADYSRPSLGVSLLVGELKKRGISAAVEYFNVTLAESIGRDLYETIANGFPPELLLGEWFFADLLFGDALPHHEDYLSKVLRIGAAEPSWKEPLLAARQNCRRFIQACVEQICRYHAKIVGFTSTFHQTCACLAVARQLKLQPSPPVIVFGGANCEGEMGLQLAKSFRLDYVCLGEGDHVFPRFVEEVLQGHSPANLPGMVKSEDASPTRTDMIENLDDLAIPDYWDYFNRIERSNFSPPLHPDLLIETSRGCWWGMKQHCSFCGLNGQTMAFRSKSQSRVLTEFRELHQRHRIHRFECVDNILDMKYIPGLFELLKESGMQLELFYEVKANLRFDQLRAMYSGGVRAIQPGIESFSSEVLKLMHKGCTGLQNLQLLRWCEELGIHAGWNILTGFPNESPSEYVEMAELVELITHIQPPATCSPVRMDRFSPFFVRAQEYGLCRVRPAASYFYVFPLGRKELSNLAYFFEFDYADGRQPLEYTSLLGRRVQRWNQLGLSGATRPRLDAVFEAGGIKITDTRSVAVAASHFLTGIAAEIYLECDTAQRTDVVKRKFPAARKEEVAASIQYLSDQKLLLQKDAHLLSLAIFRNRKNSSEVKQRVLEQPTQAQTSEQLLRVV